MTTLHLEVDIARNVERTLQTAQENLRTYIMQADQAVQQLKGGAWQGNSANEFFGYFDDWKNRSQQIVQQLEALVQALRREISEWEMAAQKLG